MLVKRVVNGLARSDVATRVGAMMRLFQRKYFPEVSALRGPNGYVNRSV